jgi:hypothetical protein
MVVVIIAVITVGLFQRVFYVIWLSIRMKHQNFSGTEGCAQLCVSEVHSFYLRLQPFQEMNRKIDERHSAIECFMPSSLPLSN